MFLGSNKAFNYILMNFHFCTFYFYHINIFSATENKFTKDEYKIWSFSLRVITENSECNIMKDNFKQNLSRNWWHLLGMCTDVQICDTQKIGLKNMSHFAYACKMWYPLNLVLESWEYLWFYWTFCIVILDYGLKLHKLSNHTLVMLQKWLEIH